MIHLIFKDFLDNKKAKEEADARRASVQIKKELKLKYVVPEIEIPIKYQLNHPKEVIECCMEEGVTVPDIAKKKSKLLVRLGIWAFVAMLVNFIIILYFVEINIDDDLRQFGYFGALFSKSLWITLFLFFCGAIMIAIINNLIIMQFDMEMKKTTSR
jgi:uncharacterized integral membrane protein